ncbi:MAG TPA: type II toxin-antitoxin system HicA family toxin [Methanothrix sp.]|jgi:predicted RNA binding protein YcfA (HicA-like mRNA interferase family)|nr:type II toxin-antitoxin system HicA family toxin [Methanothrix sp.]HOI68318.1 type II toxin-antitoxin system HicA family toxin [Methanothrix sp.]HPY73480.1 type II toxin-antitoxin system HicA family toxin [Methanothrix sp.]
MPAKAEDLERAAKTLGFRKVRQKGGHARWKHPDGRATTIPIHAKGEIGGWLFYEILKQLGISEEEFWSLLRR